MKEDQDFNSTLHPMQRFFAEALQDALQVRLNLGNSDRVQLYLSGMLMRMLHQDAAFAIRNAEGQPVRTISEMVLEGDIRYRATSFKREREVHRHIGDLMLFWTGIFPEAIPAIKKGADATLDPTAQGIESYQIAGSFSYDPFTEEAPVLKELGQNFEAYQYALALIRASMPALKPN